MAFNIADIVEHADGRLTGFEVDLADYLGRQLGKRPEFVQGQWDKLLDLLNRRDIDLVLNGYEWSAESHPAGAGGA